MKLIIFLVVCSMFFSCNRLEELPRVIDIKSFHNFGGTLFTEPRQISMKEIHLGKGSSIDSDVVIEGTIVDVGRFSTYMIMSDKLARMLVVLTDINKSYDAPQLKKNSIVKVLGRVENGKKGFPFVLAKSINIHKIDKNVNL